MTTSGDTSCTCYGQQVLFLSFLGSFLHHSILYSIDMFSGKNESSGATFGIVFPRNNLLIFCTKCKQTDVHFSEKAPRHGILSAI